MGNLMGFFRCYEDVEFYLSEEESYYKILSRGVKFGFFEN